MTISSANLDVLRDSAFEIPKTREAGDFGASLGVHLRHFFAQTARLGGPLAGRLAERAYWMRELSSSLEAAVDCTRRGRHDRAWQLIEDSSTSVLKQKDTLGIRYFTSKFDQATNSNDLSINVVMPTRPTNKSEGFCEWLVDRVRCTPPQSFGDAAKASDEALFTEAAADVRQAAGGRYMIEWGGCLRHYQHTPFGRMEYWLDRPELAVTRIDAQADPFPMVDSLGLESGVVRLVDYDDRWPLLFAAEERRIRDHCDTLALRLEHIGGTSIPGMCAKPILDIAAGRPDGTALEDDVAALERAGYGYRGERGVPGREGLSPGAAPGVSPAPGRGRRCALVRLHRLSRLPASAH